MFFVYPFVTLSYLSMQVYQYTVRTGFICDKEARKQWRTAVEMMHISKK